jgi:hypothetical protein
VKSTGTGFSCAGRPLTFTGYTFYPLTEGGAQAWGRPQFSAYIDFITSLGGVAGQNLIRPTDYWDRDRPGQRVDDEALWRNMDHLFEVARHQGAFVVMDLSAYRWLLESQGRDPYDPTAWDPFLQFVTTRYRTEPALAFYSVLGEAPPPKTSDELRKLLDFYRATTDELRLLDPNHLITAGGLTHLDEVTPALPWWRDIYALPSNDIVAFKTYSQRDLELLPELATVAAALRKPLVDEEFGLPQRLGDSTAEPGQQYNGIARSRAEFFRDVYEDGSRVGVAGYVFWNLGCVTGPDHYEVSPETPGVWAVVIAHGSGDADEASVGCADAPAPSRGQAYVREGDMTQGAGIV